MVETAGICRHPCDDGRRCQSVDGGLVHWLVHRRVDSGEATAGHGASLAYVRWHDRHAGLLHELLPLSQFGCLGLMLFMGKRICHAGNDADDRIATFVPLLHLDTHHRVWLDQSEHLGEIWILLKQMYEKRNAVELEKMRQEVEMAMKELSEEEQELAEEVEEKFEHPLESLKDREDEEE